MKNNIHSPFWTLLSLSLGLGWAGAVQVAADSATGTRGIVSTGHPLATQAAMETLQRGGNAIDAAVAAGLMLGVVDGANSGIGGSCVMTIRLANGRIVCVDGLPSAPISSSRDMFLSGGRADPGLSQAGALSVAVPGALSAYEFASAKYGRIGLKVPLLTAAAVAERGFNIDEAYAQRLRFAAGDLRVYLPGTGAFFRPDGEPLRNQELLRQPDLARAYRSIAAEGTRWFYNGFFAVQVGEWMAANRGVVVGADFVAYAARHRDPVLSTYRGHTIAGFPPPGSGGVQVAEVLNIIENFGLKDMGTNSTRLIHVTAEAMKVAAADRVRWLGDPAYTQIPAGILSKPYAAQVARQISTNRVTPVARGGALPGAGGSGGGSHTTHFSVADAQGNWVACTASLNTSFGSKIVVPGTGVLLNNSMDEFAAQPGAQNFFGVPGSAANSILLGKRPVSNMSPTIVLRGNQPVLALGSAGGTTISSQVVHTILHVVDFGMSVDQALKMPRFHHQWMPDELKLEPGAGQGVAGGLGRLGHKVSVVDSLGETQAIGWDAKARKLVGTSDPRGAGDAGGL